MIQLRRIGPGINRVIPSLKRPNAKTGALMLCSTIDLLCQNKILCSFFTLNLSAHSGAVPFLINKDRALWDTGRSGYGLIA